MKTIFRLAAAALALSALAACSTRHFDDNKNPIYPKEDRAWIHEGVIVKNPELLAIQPGVTKSQVQEQIGAPHFSEGLFGNEYWDYILRIRRNDGTLAKCRLKIQWESSKKGGTNVLKNAYWDNAECPNLLQPKVVTKEVVREVRVEVPGPERVVTVQAPAPAAITTERFTFSASVLFPTNRSGMADVNANGRAQMDKLAQDLSSRYSNLSQVVVSGHADRMGTDAHNQQLSSERANTVAQYLASRGVPVAVLQAVGKGENEPVVDCPKSASRSAQIACLQPNRRVTIDVSGVRRS